MATSFLIDVGSTIVKGARLEAGVVRANAFHTRRADETIPDQAEAVLAALGCPRPVAEADIRICSSANGGLSVGLLMLSRRVSGAVALRTLEAVGANVRFQYEWRETAGLPPTRPVDLLVLAGGVDAFSDRRVRHGVDALDLTAFCYDRLVYAGHGGAVERAQARWPGVDIVPNPLQRDLVPADRALGAFVRRTYLDDIESKRELLPLRTVSNVDIEPTPGVVSRAFERLQGRFPSPALLFDIGGATTDLHFPKELLDESALGASLLAAFPAISRHVFTAYGLHDSRRSTIAALLADPGCHDLLTALYAAEARARYLALVDGEAESRLLFAACLFLALRAALDGGEEAPRLVLGALSTLMISGGAAKGFAEADVARAAEAALGRPIRARVVCDPHYRWWTLGLMAPDEISARSWEALDD